MCLWAIYFPSLGWKTLPNQSIPHLWAPSVSMQYSSCQSWMGDDEACLHLVSLCCIWPIAGVHWRMNPEQKSAARLETGKLWLCWSECGFMLGALLLVWLCICIEYVYNSDTVDLCIHCVTYVEYKSTGSNQIKCLKRILKLLYQLDIHFSIMIFLNISLHVELDKDHRSVGFRTSH